MNHFRIFRIILPNSYEARTVNKLSSLVSVGTNSGQNLPLFMIISLHLHKDLSDKLGFPGETQRQSLVDRNVMR